MFSNLDLSEIKNGEFDSNPAIEPIPSNTTLKVTIETAEWADYEGDEYISITWAVLGPDEYKNRKVFQKLRVKDSDGKKQKKALLMLAAIDANAGGALAKSKKAVFDDMDLATALTNKIMLIKVDIWETDDGKTGNWVRAVSSGKSAPAPAVEEKDDLDDIGF
jgi:hypothetical protein